ncbi:MAG TPA: RNA-directed DNA polymerase, partial [Gemmataceae bacterium]|nr:RNA-directed DNA polymerase [Gemmataceae bacterium]
MAKISTSDLITVWRAIQTAGGIQAYVQQQLTERGFLIERRETDGMSERELAEYKKQLQAEAEERKRIRKQAWLAYRATHIVHLGEGIYWNDEPAKDKWDLPDAEERAAENELPPLDSPQQLAEALGLTVARLR